MVKSGGAQQESEGVVVVRIGVQPWGLVAFTG
jgi:hypothetical protein